jgi:hypothetical protein
MLLLRGIIIIHDTRQDLDSANVLAKKQKGTTVAAFIGRRRAGAMPPPSTAA